MIPSCASLNYGTEGCYKLNGSKSFEPKTLSTRDVPGFTSMRNPPHTQKIDSEPSGMAMVMQKSHSLAVILVVTFVITFMMSH